LGQRKGEGAANLYKRLSTAAIDTFKDELKVK